MSQLPLPIDLANRSATPTIIFGEANREAIDLLSRPEIWRGHCALLVGPQKSGRSTIAAEYARRGGMVLIDDAPQVDETALFHQWNATREASRHLLLVADEAPPLWQVALPDLRSRLATAVVARIHAPDEAMAVELIASGLSQAGTAFAPDVPPYLTARFDRSYATIHAAISVLNGWSLSSNCKISLLRAKEVLAEAGLLS